jgi:hypothetical protein
MGGLQNGMSFTNGTLTELHHLEDILRDIVDNRGLPSDKI